MDIAACPEASGDSGVEGGENEGGAHSSGLTAYLPLDMLLGPGQ
jgi:hypothetical protein